MNFFISAEDTLLNGIIYDSDPSKFRFKLTPTYVAYMTVRHVLIGHEIQANEHLRRLVSKISRIVSVVIQVCSMFCNGLYGCYGEHFETIFFIFGGDKVSKWIHMPLSFLWGKGCKQTSLFQINIKREIKKWKDLVFHYFYNFLFTITQENQTKPTMLAFWMANSSELLHFFTMDRDLGNRSIEAQDQLAASVQMAFLSLVDCLKRELHQVMHAFIYPHAHPGRTIR